MKKQVFNPYLPLWEYVPDGEPHLFDGRVYIYGSHDAPQGDKYCVGDYVTWSAPEDDLTDWRYEGVIYRKTQDPSNAKGEMELWAPDVTCGPDGRYYLYYCFSFYPEIGVAVSDSPAGPFEFYGHVRYPAHVMGGKTLQEFMPFDPAVLTDEDGQVYLYYGFAPAGEKEMTLPDPESLPPEERGKIEQLKNVAMGENGMVVELEPDMVTLRNMPKPCIPGENHSAGTSFEGHGFFEASSIRKVGKKYYMVYSSHKSHELCYAVSDYPDQDYVYGGTLVSNGDIGLDGRDFPVNTLGNNHGGMVCANGTWYIFYHRQTNGTEFSRQGCAERIEIQPDGSIRQVEITSCGLNGGPLEGAGTYPAAIACHVTCKDSTARIDYQNPAMKQWTRITQDVTGGEEKSLQYLTDIRDGSVIGYKYFECKSVKSLSLKLRGDYKGKVVVSVDAKGEQPVGETEVAVSSGQWTQQEVAVKLADGVFALYLFFYGDGALDMETISFSA